jgi:hypothetical protein
MSPAQEFSRQLNGLSLEKALRALAPTRLRLKQV